MKGCVKGTLKMGKEPILNTSIADDKVSQMIDSLGNLSLEMELQERTMVGMCADISDTYQQSARNLLHYMALRQHDMRDLQETLAIYGLSSLGRAESHVMATVNAVMKALSRMQDPGQVTQVFPEPVSICEGRRLLDEHSSALLGPVAVNRSTRIMVTLPSGAASDYEMVRDLLEGGMDCVRINCAYDSTEEWGQMIDNLRRAERHLGKNCKVFMDLAGHKLRTGPVEPDDPVIRWSTGKNRKGKTIKPAILWIAPDTGNFTPSVDVDAVLKFPVGWLSRLKIGDRVEFHDARGKRRHIDIVASTGLCLIGECTKGAYVTPETEFIHHTSEASPQAVEAGHVAHIPGKEKVILLHNGDTLILTRDCRPGNPPLYDITSRMVAPASIGITLPEVFGSVRQGERIWFDDGKIGGIIRSVSDDHLRVEITHAKPKGSQLRSGKGINLPDSQLGLPPLTEKDREDLHFIARHADAVCFSFVSKASDVYELQSRLSEIGRGQPGIVMKIETIEAFEHLPELLLAAMRSPAAGVMIARGDLAVECGYERMAEVQEEILWFCEAAHMPVIWATQVLETLAKKGLPSRAEITDAAMGVRAECVMLNKGPYILEAIATLDDILGRMQAHQKKKVSMLRKLHVAQNLKQA